MRAAREYDRVIGNRLGLGTIAVVFEVVRGTDRPVPKLSILIATPILAWMGGRDPETMLS